MRLSEFPEAIAMAAWHRVDLYVLIAAIAVSVAAATPGIAAMLSAPYPPSWGGDAYGHLFKIWKLVTSGWPSWIRDWYSGYPFLRFYPPLSYLAGAFFAEILGSPEAGYKAVIVLDLGVAAAATYAMLRLLGFNVYASLLGSLVYATSPWLYRVIAPEGNYPRAMGMALAPLLVAALIAGMRRRRVSTYLLTGLGVAAVLLSHHSVFATYLLASLFIVSAEYLALWVSGGGVRETLRRHLASLLPISLAFLAVTAFWLAPFIKDHELASFIPETSSYLFRFQSAKPSLILKRDPGGWGYYQGPVRLGLVAAALVSAAVAREKRLLARQLVYTVLAALLLVLALGAYGPAPSLDKLPVIRMIPPYRWLDPLQAVYALSAAVLLDSLYIATASRAGRWGRLVAVAVLAAAVLLAAADAVPQLSHWRGEHFDGDLAAALMLIRGDGSTGWRFYQWGLAITRGSMVGFSPALAQKPCLDGWYRQGDPLYIMHGELAWALTHDAAYAKKLLRAFAVKYVVLDERYRGTPRAEETLREIGFTKLFQSGPIVVYGWGNASLLQPIPGRMLVISCSPGVVKHLFPGAVTGESCYLDDYSARELEKYSVVVLYDYRYQSPGAWRSLASYVASGGTLVVDTYRSPDMLRGIPWAGIASEISRIKGLARISLWNGTVIALNLSYRGAAWVSTIYSGAGLEPLARLGNKTVIGVARHGEGRVIVVGLNLFYYTYLHRDKALEKLLKEIIPARGRGEEPWLELLAWRDGEIVFRYSSPGPVALRVSEAWYPYWRLYIDDRECRGCITHDKLGLVELSLPSGTHEARLVFQDPYAALRPATVAALVAILAAAALERRGGSR